MENMGKTASMHNFGRRISRHDTPGEITGGLRKMHLAELSARYRPDWNCSQYMVQFLFRMYANERYNFIETKKILGQLNNCKCIKGKTAAYSYFCVHCC